MIVVMAALVAVIAATWVTVLHRKPPRRPWQVPGSDVTLMTLCEPNRYDYSYATTYGKRIKVLYGCASEKPKAGEHFYVMREPFTYPQEYWPTYVRHKVGEIVSMTGGKTLEVKQTTFEGGPVRHVTVRAGRSSRPQIIRVRGWYRRGEVWIAMRTVPETDDDPADAEVFFNGFAGGPPPH